MSVYGTSFVYDDISSDEYGLMLCTFGSSGMEETDMSLGIDIVYEDTDNAIKKDYGITYSKPLSFPITVAKKDGSYITLQEVRQITRWLTGRKRPHWLQVFNEELEEVFYMCRATEILKNKIGDKTIGFTITFTCNSPFGFSDEIVENITVDSADYVYEIYNDSDDESYVQPYITATMNSTSLKILNSTTNKIFNLTGLTVGDIVTIDNLNQMIFINGEYRYLGETFNLVWLDLAQGLNELTINGNCDLEIKYRSILKVGEI